MTYGKHAAGARGRYFVMSGIRFNIGAKGSGHVQTESKSKIYNLNDINLALIGP